MDAISSCDNKARLLAEYQTANEAYLKAMRDLIRSVGSTTRIEFERLDMVTERARSAYTEARKNLDLHTYQHGC